MSPSVAVVLGLLLVAAVVAVVLIRSGANGGGESKSEVSATVGPSIYDQIVQQVGADLDALLEVEEIQTDDPESGGAIRFAAGAQDALFGSSGEGGEWKAVLKKVRRIAHGKPTTWQELDAITAEASTAENVDLLLGRLTIRDATPAVKAQFWELATKSRRDESVKWGIAIGGVDLKEAELPALLVLARHAEFTLYAAHVLMREGERHPSLHRKLVELLPSSRQWGVIRLIDYITTTSSLIESRDVQRDVLIFGIENNAGLSMEVAFTIASSIDVRTFIQESRDNRRVYYAIAGLMDSLLTESSPLGGLAQLDGWEEIYLAWIGFVEERESDTTLLGSLRSLRYFLREEVPNWDRRMEETGRIERLWRSKYSSDVLRKGLQDERERWLALQIVKESGSRELLPDVRAAHATKPDYSTIDVLASLGGDDDLRALLESTPTLVDLEARKQRSLSRDNVFGPEHQNSMEYGLVIRALGKLATQEAIEAITRARTDYDPHIRAAACAAVAVAPSEKVTPEVRDLIRLRLGDSPAYVVEEAQVAAQAHSIRR